MRSKWWVARRIWWLNLWILHCFRREGISAQSQQAWINKDSTNCQRVKWRSPLSFIMFYADTPLFIRLCLGIQTHLCLDHIDRGTMQEFCDTKEIFGHFPENLPSFQNSRQSCQDSGQFWTPDKFEFLTDLSRRIQISDIFVNCQKFLQMNPISGFSAACHSLDQRWHISLWIQHRSMMDPHSSPSAAKSFEEQQKKEGSTHTHTNQIHWKGFRFN